VVATYTGVVQLDGMVFDEATDYGVCFLVNASSAFLVEQVRVRVRVRVGLGFGFGFGFGLGLGLAGRGTPVVR